MYNSRLTALLFQEETKDDSQGATGARKGFSSSDLLGTFLLHFPSPVAHIQSIHPYTPTCLSEFQPRVQEKGHMSGKGSLSKTLD